MAFTERLQTYAQKFKGIPDSKTPDRNPVKSIAISTLLSFVGMLVVASVDHHGGEVQAVIGSFGASAVLIYTEAITSPLAQARNLIGGHLCGAFAGVTVYKVFKLLNALRYLWVASALSVSFAIALQELTRTVHPPGGATAFIFVAGSKTLHDLGYLYMIYPVGLGAVLLLCVAVLGNNLVDGRQYPMRWW